MEIERIDDLFAIKGGNADDTIIVHCNVAGSGYILPSKADK